MAKFARVATARKSTLVISYLNLVAYAVLFGPAMIQGLYQSAAAADALQTWNDVIARNIAAASTPGFKKDSIAFDGIDAGAGTSFEQIALSPTPRNSVSFQAGDVRRSGNPLEFAIDGSGFFRLQRADGEFVYTRDGEFHVAPDGQLVSKQGFPVAGESGPVQLLIEGGPPTVDAEGRVRQGDQEIGVLSIYDFADTATLQRTNGGFVVDAVAPQTATVAEGSHVQQGFLELSNVSAVHEMVDLITVNNALQANQRYIQSLDSTMERAIQVLGSTAS